MKWNQIKSLFEYFEHHSIDEFQDFMDYVDSKNDDREINEDNFQPHQLALIEFMEFFNNFETFLADEGMMHTFFKPYTIMDGEKIPTEHKNKRLYIVFKDGITNLQNDIKQLLTTIKELNTDQKMHPKLQKVIDNISQCIKMVDSIIAFEPTRYDSYFPFNEHDKEKAINWVKQIQQFFDQLLTTSPEDYGLDEHVTKLLQAVIERSSSTYDLLKIKPNDTLSINFKLVQQFDLMQHFYNSLTSYLCNNIPAIKKQYNDIREQLNTRLKTINFYTIADEARDGDYSRVIPIESQMTADQAKVFREIEQLLIDMAELFDLL